MAKKGKLDHIKEMLKDIEGGRDYAFANLAELYLVSDMVIPPKFKVSDFDRYKETSCPKNHLKMYCRKMGGGGGVEAGGEPMIFYTITYNNIQNRINQKRISHKFFLEGKSIILLIKHNWTRGT